MRKQNIFVERALWCHNATNKGSFKEILECRASSLKASRTWKENAQYSPRAHNEIIAICRSLIIVWKIYSCESIKLNELYSNIYFRTNSVYFRTNSVGANSVYIYIFIQQHVYLHVYFHIHGRRNWSRRYRSRGTMLRPKLWISL